METGKWEAKEHTVSGTRERHQSNEWHLETTGKVCSGQSWMVVSGLCSFRSGNRRNLINN